MRQGPDLDRPTYGRKEGGDQRGFSGEFWSVTNPLFNCAGNEMVCADTVQVLRSWLMDVLAKETVVRKSFDMTLPVGGGHGCNKKITYTNPYLATRVFHVRASRPDLVYVKEPRMEVGPNRSASIGLQFAPAATRGFCEILIFINDEEDRNEDTFCVKVTYQ